MSCDNGRKRAKLDPSCGKADSTRRRIGIFGGAFDPITNAHLTCIAEILRSGVADEAWLVPCGPRPDKPKLKTLPLHRLTMCQVAVNSTFSPDFPVKVLDAECWEEEALFTYDLLCHLQELHPNIDFTFVIGSDWLQPGTNIAEWTSLNKEWKKGDPIEKKEIVTGQKLLQEFDFLVVRRPGFETETTAEDPSGLKKFGPRLSWMSMPAGMHFIESSISSTEVRRRLELAQQASTRYSMTSVIEGLVPAGVIGYIIRQGLYVV